MVLDGKEVAKHKFLQVLFRFNLKFPRIVLGSN